MAPRAETESFDQTVAGQLPNGWVSGVTGRGSPRWAVVAEPSAPSKPNVLKQSGVGTYPWAVKKDVALVDGFVETRFMAISGKEDQAAGVVWRWQSGRTYYVARANANENNVAVYYTTLGVRSTIRYVDAPVPRNVWHTLRAEFNGRTIRIFLNGKVYIEAEDGHIAGAGAIGVWTKADSVTVFDNVSYGPP
jgi:hypothetical protein